MSTELTTAGRVEGPSEPPPPIPHPRVRLSPDWLTLGEKYGLVVLFLLLVGVFSAVDSSTFPTKATLTSMALTQAVTAILALGLIFTLVGGNFDLSVGSNAVMCSILCAGFMSKDGVAFIPAALISILAGMFVGAVNGVMVTKARFNSLIATLGSAAILDALAQWYTNGLPISNGISQNLLNLGTKTAWAFPWIAVIAAILGIAAAYVLTQTPYGRRLAATGANPSAARLVGLRTNRLTLLSFIIGGALAGIGGVLLVAQQGSAEPSASGVSVLVPALTVAFLGASAFRPGEFNVPGMFIALALVAVLVNGLTLSGAASWVQPLCYGAALLAGVGITAAFRAKRLGGSER